MTSSVRGAYGLGLRDAGPDQHLVGGAERWLHRAPAGWPVWEIEFRKVEEGWRELEESFDDEHGRLRAHPGGMLQLDRLAARAVLSLPRALDSEGLVHPYLSSLASFVGHWLGRTTLHAGSFALAGGVWGLLGDQEMGKSSVLMGLHQQGLTVVSDDVMVVHEDHVFSGPRCLDLRRSSSERFGEGRPLGWVGRRERWRVDLPEVAPSLRLRGWVVLAWSDTIDVAPLPAADRLAALAANRAVRAPGVVPRQRFLDLVAAPAVRFSRPRDWSRFEEGVERLVATLSAF